MCDCLRYLQANVKNPIDIAWFISWLGICDGWHISHRAETEAKELRRETLLLGEIVRKFRETATLHPKIVEAERDNQITNTYKNQVWLLKFWKIQDLHQSIK